MEPTEKPPEEGATESAPTSPTLGTSNKDEALQPPLGRNESVGDTQPSLGERQTSEAGAPEPPVASPPVTDGLSEAPAEAPEPAAPEPEAPEPEAPEPEAPEPAVPEPEAPEPEAPEPAVPEPAAPVATPEPAAPVATPEPAVAEPAVAEPAVPEPAVAEPAAPEPTVPVATPALAAPEPAAPEPAEPVATPALADSKPKTEPVADAKPPSAGAAAAQATAVGIQASRFGVTTPTIAHQGISVASPSSQLHLAPPAGPGFTDIPPQPNTAVVAQRPPGPPGLGLPSTVASAGTAAASVGSQLPSPQPSAPPPPVENTTVQHQSSAVADIPSGGRLPAAPPTIPGPPRPSPAAAAAAPAPRPPAPGMRELRVEDALLYLDDVKREFGDRPRVYNEFLAIMKNFKSQEVDTPGVIARVSKLFRGYNNLILGFNKFLPDGYKISLADLEEADALYAREQEELKRQAAIAGSAAMSRQGSGFGAPTSAGIVSGYQQQGVSPAAALSVSPAPPRPPMQGSLETVRRSPIEQGDVRPRGPPGLESPARAAFPPTVQAPSQQLPPGAPQNRVMQPTIHQPVGPASATQQPSRVIQPTIRQQSVPQAQQKPQAQPPAQQAVEFDHAISYVTTIKRRFAHEPSTYHAFLEILHTYQKEQRGIKEVLEQVSHLFQDHPDLLKEFTFFLPDAVQEQAKERLHRAAADSEARQAAQRAQLEQQKHGGHVDMDVDPSGKHRLIDMTRQQLAEPEAQRGRKRSHKEAASEPSPTIVLPQQPESYVYNSAVERQFFDAAREALAAYTRDGGQAWAEFLKCLDMYAQEILSRSEMLNFVEPLLGKRNNKLFEEFKRIINSAGAQSLGSPSIEDSWYSVPLSEIDFSRCRRCSPSYRALPRDYPSPPCSDRSDEEAKVLNDVWVSLPVGSEESYTFRHMRRNTYEEVLFRCEDERFEIDMVIDSNLTTLMRLEPIAEEIAQLAENELILPETSNTPKPASLDQGMGGKRFQYTFDRNILGVIHRNSIARIYGDAGQEILDLIVKNPTVAVPLVVERLRQKDREWRKVRTRLNKRWRELAEHNYYRSLDHRSLTWRTTDKRAISTRTLVSEIKDRAQHNGNEGSAARQARIDKLKEEHGGFYETTMGKSLRTELDITNLPKPDRRLFTPHMSFMYENIGWVHRDAYRILSFALERGSIPPSDKERCHRMWFDFLGPWFNLSMDWMMKPAVHFQETTKLLITNEFPRVVSAGDESMADEDEEESADEEREISARVVTEDVRQIKHHDKHSSPSHVDHHPLPAGAAVSTVYGDGRIISCRRSDDTYIVQLAFGKAYLRPSAVLCSIIPADKSAYTSQLRGEDRTKLERPADMLAIGTQSLYLFFRLHQILVQRLVVAKQLAHNVIDDQTIINMVEQMSGSDAAALGKRRYDAYLSLVFALLDGGHTLSGSAAEGGKYEDRVRALLGHGGYELATMDKLISHILKNLQSLANDDTMWNLVQLYRRHLDAGSFKPEAFRMEAGYLSDGEPMFAFQLCPVQKDGGDKSVIHMEYLGVIAESDEEDALMADAPSEPQQQQSKRQKR